MGETQESVVEWMYATFPGVDPDSPRKSIRALEEMVELCIASGASGALILHAVEKAVRSSPRLGPDGFDAGVEPDKVPEEAADVLIVLYGVAGMRGFDLSAEVDRKMAINRGRRWEACGDGTGYHVASGADTGGAS